MPLIVKFIFNLYITSVSYAVIASAISAVSKYHITDKNTYLTVGKHTQVTHTMESFWELRPPLPKYQNKNVVQIVLRFI